MRFLGKRGFVIDLIRQHDGPNVGIIDLLSLGPERLRAALRWLPGPYLNTQQPFIFKNREITDTLRRKGAENIITLQDQIGGNPQFISGSHVGAPYLELLVLARSVIFQVISAAIALGRAKPRTSMDWSVYFAAAFTS